MLRVAVTGGIGAGKTAATDYLASLEIPIVDADVVARTVLEPGQPAYVALVDAFGSAVLREGGGVDRSFLAEVVFHDATALRRLNAITHPYVAAETSRRLDELSAALAVVAVPLFQPVHRETFSLDEVWSVQADPAIALRRLCERRGFREADARARMATQMSNDERAALVDRVLWNEGTVAELHTLLNDALEAMRARRD